MSASLYFGSVMHERVKPVSNPIDNETALNRVFYSNPLVNLAYRAAHWWRANSRRAAARISPPTMI